MNDSVVGLERGGDLEQFWSDCAFFLIVGFTKTTKISPKNSKTFVKNQQFLEDNEEKRFLEDSGWKKYNQVNYYVSD